MNHMEIGPSTIIGVALVTIGILLYALKEREPSVSRYYDFFFSSVGLLCGGILFFQGWRLDPILLLSQILLSGTTIFFILETIFLRSNSNYIKYKKKSNVSSEFERKNIYKNLKLPKELLLSKFKIDKINYTVHISYWKKNE
uniref:Ycf66 n=1 Tax=Cololejeunea lanciloba TaxID=1186967 RepID=A0A4Y5P5W4_9MARC|nr:Ycf66 [Cololejeunea lanciloba]QCW58406.1 Ycf66 [Cololejeunea lanciloba]